MEPITFLEKNTRYVRMPRFKRGWWYGYSLRSFDVLGETDKSEGLNGVYFIRLRLKDKGGKLISENSYWEGSDCRDFTALNQLPKAELKISSKMERKGEKAEIRATTELPESTKSVTFVVHVQVVRTVDGEHILPAITGDNYSALMLGGNKEITINFNKSLLKGGPYKLPVTPYNN